MNLRFQRGSSAGTGGRLSYQRNDGYFVFEPAQRGRRPLRGFGALLVQYLQLIVDLSTGEILWVQGSSPESTWRRAPLPTIGAPVGSVIVSSASSAELSSETAEEIDGSWAWITQFDPDSGVLYCGQATGEPTDSITIATGTVLDLRGEDLVGLWLAPS